MMEAGTLGALDRDDLTLEELVAETEKLLAKLAPQQTRYKVSERPDARTIRYYVSQKLLPRPLGYAGGRARYGSSHLLRLLLIKKLQAKHQTLRQIRALLGELGDDEVRGRLWPAELQDTPTTAPGGATTLTRFTLTGGGSVDLPTTRLEDDHLREEAARELEALAARLRQQ